MILLRAPGLLVASYAVLVVGRAAILLHIPDRWGEPVLRADFWLLRRVLKLEQDRRRAAWFVLFGERYRK